MGKQQELAADGETLDAEWEAVSAALGRVIATVPKSTAMDVYKSVSAITETGVQVDMRSLMNDGDAEEAHSAYLDFKGMLMENRVSLAVSCFCQGFPPAL